MDFTPHMMFVIEEASGVPNVIFETASGALSTPGAKIIMCGNPTRSDGYFYDAFHSDREWHCLTVSCEDGEYVDPKFITDMAEKYGESSNVFRVSVLGEFPTQSDDVLLPLHLVEDATHRDVEAGPTTPVIWDVSPDLAQTAQRSPNGQGNVLIEPIKTWQNKDLMELAGIVLAEHDAVPYSMRPASDLYRRHRAGRGAGRPFARVGLACGRCVGFRDGQPEGSI